jgi:MFS family permease
VSLSLIAWYRLELKKMAVFMIVGVTLYWLSSGTPGNRILFTIGKLLTGFPLGVFITVAPTYCSEIAPPVLRGAVTAAVNWSIVLGQLLTYIVMSATQSLSGLNSYRIVFAVQWGLAGIALVALPFFPESPYHLVSQGRLDKARQNVLKLHGKDFDASGFLASIVVDLDTEIKMKRKASFRECFKGHNRQRTFIAMSTFLVQAFCGISWITGSVTSNLCSKSDS